MTEAERIADQHRRAFDGEAWHGPHVFEVLEGVSAERAAARPIPEAHTIWEIVLHVRAWEEIVLRRLRGERVDVTPERDWPPVTDTSQAAWLRALAALRETHDQLQREIAKVPDSRLDEPVAAGSTPLYRLLHGQVQHALYHAGQIALLKKG
ncbi:MAG TPA: DinB family protein [Candidatus Limnocylindrales bacterium]|nr:DinB family protein [Candidatus Limnocylindrales bacterium]